MRIRKIVTGRTDNTACMARWKGNSDKENIWGTSKHTEDANTAPNSGDEHGGADQQGCWSSNNTIRDLIKKLQNDSTLPR